VLLPQRLHLPLPAALHPKKILLQHLSGSVCLTVAAATIRDPQNYRAGAAPPPGVAAPRPPPNLNFTSYHLTDPYPSLDSFFSFRFSTHIRFLFFGAHRTCTHPTHLL
jgi:hypothetical protein